jgi:myo-inositol 2-dehydrogenase / D-chiro-inositol 1-dehydrogenase
MRIAVVGTGRMGAFRAEQVRAREHEAVVASGDPARGRLLADVLAEDIDAAIVSSSTDRHPEHVLACVERDLSVLCEKPIALSLRETCKVLDRVAAAGGTLQVSFQRRFDAGFAAARAAVADGRLGTWLEVVAGERADPCPGEEALEALQVAVACELSAREGRPVRVEEVTDDAP